jgi:hypothetical protein
MSEEEEERRRKEKKKRRGGSKSYMQLGNATIGRTNIILFDITMWQK